MLKRNIGRDKNYGTTEGSQLRIEEDINMEFAIQVLKLRYEVGHKKYKISKNLLMNIFIKMYLNGEIEIPKKYYEEHFGTLEDLDNRHLA